MAGACGAHSAPGPRCYSPPSPDFGSGRAADLERAGHHESLGFSRPSGLRLWAAEKAWTVEAIRTRDAWAAAVGRGERVGTQQATDGGIEGMDGCVPEAAAGLGCSCAAGGCWSDAEVAGGVEGHDSGAGEAGTR